MFQLWEFLVASDCKLDDIAVFDQIYFSNFSYVFSTLRLKQYLYLLMIHTLSPVLYLLKVDIICIFSKIIL